MMDAGYHNAAGLGVAAGLGLEILCPAGKANGGDESWEQNRKKLGKHLFRFDSERDCYVCPDGRELLFEYRARETKKTRGHARYRSKDCSGCSLASRCLGRGSRTRTMKPFASDALKEAVRQQMEQPQARKRYKRRRATVEPVFAELKGVQGMTRFRRRGLAGVRVEHALHAAAHNLRRYVALSRVRRPPSRDHHPRNARRRSRVLGVGWLGAGASDIWRAFLAAEAQLWRVGVVRQSA